MIAGIKKAVCIAGKTAKENHHKFNYITPQKNSKWFSRLLDEAVETANIQGHYKQVEFLRNLLWVRK